MFNWVIDLVDQSGYVGIALLMLAKNLFPPIPSELIMPMAGFTTARGGLSLTGALLAGALGSVAGALFWYYIGWWVSEAPLPLGRGLTANAGGWQRLSTPMA